MGVLKQGEDRVFSPVKGTYVHLKDVSDATFNSGVLGTGFAVDPEEDVIHAPVEGTISAVFRTCRWLHHGQWSGGAGPYRDRYGRA